MKSIVQTLKESTVKVPYWLQEDVDHGMKEGWIIGDDNRKYGCSEENIASLFLDPGYSDNVDVTEYEITAAIINAQNRGIKFKYKTVKDIKKDNPNLNIP